MEQRAFSCAGRAADSEDFSLGDLEIDAAQNLESAVAVVKGLHHIFAFEYVTHNEGHPPV